jgi:hypothetical protein
MAGSRKWPEMGQEFLDQLSAVPGRIGFAVADPDGMVIAALSELLGEQPLSVGRRVTQRMPPSTVPELILLLSGSRLLIDLDVLFWPALLALDPISLLSTLSRHKRSAVLAQWPGTVIGSEMIYSAPGRPDYFRTSAKGHVILSPQHRVFPDDVPFVVEWL